MKEIVWSSYIREDLGMKPVLFNSRNISYEGTIVNHFSELEKIVMELGE